MEAKKPALSYERVMDQIKQMILSGEYKVGDRLPSERELAERFEVSRVPVRESLKILGYLGVVEIAPGDGVYLRNLLGAPLVDPRRFSLNNSKEFLADIFELRCILEADACYYAAIRCTDEDKERLVTLVRQAREQKLRLQGSLSDEEREKALTDLRMTCFHFHTAVVNAAHNKALDDLYNNLFEAMEISRDFAIEQEGHSFNGIMAHELIAEKIISGDPDQAQAYMRMHLNGSKEQLEQAVAARD